MKFVSWNVNGLRACVQKGFLEYFNEIDADFFCLQETKLSEGQLQLSMPGYEQYWCYAEKKGYSGTAIFTKHTPLSVSYGIGVPELDNEGRVITLEYQEFYLVTCYTPNAQRGLARLEHRIKWDEAFRAYLKGLDESKSVIFCGDLNVAHKEIDLKNPASNRGNAGFSDEERESFQKTLDMGFTDTFRHLYPNATGKYSWWSYMYHARENNAGWRIDYFLVSDRLCPAIERADIHSHVMGSDHCPVVLDLDTMVNGSIWSPSSTGKATVIEPEEKKKKETRASAATAKALVAFGALFALIMGGIGLLWEKVNTKPGPPTQPFEVYTYLLPLESKKMYVSQQEYAVPKQTDFTLITDGDELACYTGTEDMNGLSEIDEANIWIRLELTQEGKKYAAAGWELDVKDLVFQQDVQDPLYNGLFFTDFSIAEYYTDRELTDQAGWLIWGRCNTGGTLTLQLLDTAGNAGYWTNADCSPYLTLEEADALSTMELIRMVLEHEVIYEKIAGRSLKAMNPDYAFCTRFPIYNELLTRTDAVIPLMYADYSTDGWLNFELLSLPVFRDQMTPDQEADFLTFQFDSCPDVLSLRSDGDFLSAPLHDYTTESLVQMLRELDLSPLTLCSSEEVRALAYANFKEVYPLLTELESRADAATAMMNASEYMMWEDVSLDVFCYVLHHLLGLDVYRSKMTPMEDAQYALCLYGYYLEITSITPIDLEADSMSTTKLLYALEPYITGLVDCSGNASRYNAYTILSILYPDLEDLMSREDLLDVLKPLSIFHRKDEPVYEPVYNMGSYNLCDTLIELRYYMDELEAAEEMTTKELIQYVRHDQTVVKQLSMSFLLPEESMMLVNKVIQNSPALSLLSEKDDAVTELMNSERLKDDYTISWILYADVFRSAMTPRQEADYITLQYNSYPDPDATAYADGLVDTAFSTMSTADLLTELCDFGYSLYALEECTNPLTASYVLEFLAKRYNRSVGELLSRDDLEDTLISLSETQKEVNYFDYPTYETYDRLRLLIHYTQVRHSCELMTTEDLVAEIMIDERMESELSQALFSGLNDITVSATMKTVALRYPALTTLLEREDATAVLLTYFGQPVTDYLLLIDTFRQQMTPEQEAQYFLGLSQSSVIQPVIMPETDAIRNMSTTDLLTWLMECTNLLQVILRGSTTEAHYYMYSYHSNTSAELRSFMNRGDLLEVLVPLSRCHNADGTVEPGNYNVYDHLIELRYYMDDLQ